MLRSNNLDCVCVDIDLTTLAVALDCIPVVFTSLVYATHSDHAEPIIGTKGLRYEGIQSAGCSVVTCGNNERNIFFLTFCECTLHYVDLTLVLIFDPA
jgi:hypothetical protein